jgi:exosortase/archaeosortase family protein
MKKPGKAATRADRKPVVMFLIKCLLYWGATLWLVSRFSFVENAGINLTIATLQRVMGALGQPIQRAGSAIYASGASIEIVSDCSPHMPFLIFAAVILAFPSSWRQRSLGLLFGAAVIHVFNTVRIMTLIWILSWRHDWFEFVHVYLWQTGTILIVFLTFALWIRTVSPRPRPA